MKYLRIFEEFDRDGYQSHWTKFEQWLSDRDFELYDGTEDLKNKFLEVANNDDLSVEEKSDEITNYLEMKWGRISKRLVSVYLDKLFMDEV
jgi:hypothetical protein